MAEEGAHNPECGEAQRHAGFEGGCRAFVADEGRESEAGVAGHAGREGGEAFVAIAHDVTTLVGEGEYCVDLIDGLRGSDSGRWHSEKIGAGWMGA